MCTLHTGTWVGDMRVDTLYGGELNIYYLEERESVGEEGEEKKRRERQRRARERHARSKRGQRESKMAGGGQGLWEWAWLVS